MGKEKNGLINMGDKIWYLRFADDKFTIIFPILSLFIEVLSGSFFNGNKAFELISTPLYVLFTVCTLFEFLHFYTRYAVPEKYYSNDENENMEKAKPKISDLSTAVDALTAGSLLLVFLLLDDLKGWLRFANVFVLIVLFIEFLRVKYWSYAESVVGKIEVKKVKKIEKAAGVIGIIVFLYLVTAIVFAVKSGWEGMALYLGIPVILYFLLNWLIKKKTEKLQGTDSK